MKTTINVRDDIFEGICGLCKRYEVSMRSVVCALLDRITVCDVLPVITGCCVSYQQKCDVWHNSHITFSEAEYERNSRLRLFHKLSLSLIIAFAFELYGDSLFERENSRSSKNSNSINDSYHKKPYIFIQTDFSLQTFCIFFWEVKKNRQIE